MKLEEDRMTVSAKIIVCGNWEKTTNFLWWKTTIIEQNWTGLLPKILDGTGKEWQFLLGCANYV